MNEKRSRDELLNGIIEIEWEMFQEVPNIGGKASCQEDLRTFRIMRSSQATSWSDAALESYLTDLQEAKKKGRNLLAEKYARMMKSTSPLEYAQIEHLIPPLAPEVPPLIDKIVEVILEWEKELSREFSYIVKRGRPIYSSEDTPSTTSLETYLRGELATYSERTLELYYDHLLKQKSENINGSRIILEHTIKQYGYESLEEANEKLRASSPI
jgi:hypothetical protein